MISAVIKISPFNESPKRAIQSIISNLNYVKDVHIIHPGYTAPDCMYDGWSEDRKSLATKAVLIEADLNASNFDPECLVVEIPPTCELKLGAFNILLEEGKCAKSHQTHLALSTRTILPGNSLFYGFFVVLFTIDWIWNRLFEFNKLIQYNDVKGRFIIKKGKSVHFPERSFTWRIWNAETIPKVYTKHASVLETSIVRTLYNHLYLGWGLWIFILFPIWIVVTLVFLSMQGSVYAILMWITMSTLAFLTTKDYLVMGAGMKLFSILAFPFYFIASPLLLVYAKNK